jgi:THO complex subunit 5
MALVDTTNTANLEHALPASPDAVIADLQDLVSSAYLNHDIASVNIRAGALFARLKALNRSANAATRAHKQATAETRHDMDQTYLGLQNLLYEKRHLEREIEKCRQFA